MAPCQLAVWQRIRSPGHALGERKGLRLDGAELCLRVSVRTVFLDNDCHNNLNRMSSHSELTANKDVCWPNGSIPIYKRPLRKSPVEGGFWPKVALNQQRKSVRLRDSHEGLESTPMRHSSSLTRTSVIGSQSGHPAAPIQ
jgi:hypothetical protein